MRKPAIWIYLSPHFDDVALSCGGLVWEQTQRVDAVSIWTLCAGEPPDGAFSPFAEDLHRRWEAGREATTLRRQEDLASCEVIGATGRYFTVPDCIYRRGGTGNVVLYASESALFGPLHPLEAPLVEELAAELSRELPGEAEVVCPLAVGGHVDHRLVRLAAECLGRPLWYYTDVPYVLTQQDELAKLSRTGWRAQVFPISADGLAAWDKAITAHASQISSFWPDLHSMRAAIGTYCQENGGIRLWRATY